MSEKKTYSPEEAAKVVLGRVHELVKKSELYKSNTAHEVETGEEPNNDDAECPEYLANADIEGDGDKKAKKRPSYGGDSDPETDADSKPEHEKGMSEEEEKEHDAAENEADEKDADKVEADEEDGDDNSEMKEKKKVIADAAEDKKKPPFEKSEMEKSLFSDKTCAIAEVGEYKPTKKEVAEDIRWKLETLQKIRELKWTVEEHAPEAKKALESMYDSCLKEIKKLCKKHSSMKKSIEDALNKLEKSEKKGTFKLKKFLAEKTEKLEKACMEKKQGVPKGANPATYERCVKKVKGKVKNPYAVCAASGAGRSGKNKKMEKYLGVETDKKQGLTPKASPKEEQSADVGETGIKGY